MNIGCGCLESLCILYFVLKGKRVSIGIWKDCGSNGYDVIVKLAMMLI
jgi:hypothetical protein